MNIFVLDLNPKRAAKLLCDKHVVKMIVESAQMLCTAHRELDGVLGKGDIILKKWYQKDNIKYQVNCKKRKFIKILPHFNEFETFWIPNSATIFDVNTWEYTIETTIYLSAHVNHPCNIWVRDQIDQYMWLYEHFIALLNEYTYRYNKIHSCEFLREKLSNSPRNIKTEVWDQTPFALAMKNRPDCTVSNDTVQSYRNYYCTKNFEMKWTKRLVPEWYKKETA